jgi:hypothetical protein
MEELAGAFKGQHAVVVALSISAAFRFTDTTLAAGMQPLIPSEFGASDFNPQN